MLCSGSCVVFESVICSVLNVVDSGWPWWAGRSPWCRRLVWYLCCHLFVYIYAAIYLWYWQLLMYWFIYCFIIFYSHVDMWYLYCHLFVYICSYLFMIWTIINVFFFLLFLLLYYIYIYYILKYLTQKGVNKLLISWARLKTVVLHFVLPTAQTSLWALYLPRFP
jgi:hypothetical protein